MTLPSFSLFNILGLTAALRIMDLVALMRSTAAAVISHHSAQAAAAASRRLPPQSGSRIWTTALRLLLISLLPLTLTFLLLTHLSHSLRFRLPKNPRNRTVLLTTTTTQDPPSRALAVARALHATGHTVIIASANPPSPSFLSLLHRLLPPATSFSASVAHHVRLPDTSAPRLEDDDGDDDASAAALHEHAVLGAILRFRPHAWIPCELFAPPAGRRRRRRRRGMTDAVVAAMREAPASGRGKAGCGVLAAEGAVARMVRERTVFEEMAGGLGRGGGARRAFVVRRRGEVHALVHAGRGKTGRWVMEERDGDGGEVELPAGDLDEVYERVARLDVSDARPWTVREAAAAEEEEEEEEAWTAHFVVVRGRLRALAASRADAAASGRCFLEPSAPLHESIVSFVDAFVAALPARTSAPLAVHFAVRTEATDAGTASTVLPTRCAWAVPPLGVPPFSAALADLVDSVCAPPSAAKSITTSAPVSPAPLHTPPTSPVLLAPVADRFVAPSLPTPPSSPSSRSRSAHSPQQRGRRELSGEGVFLPPGTRGVHSLPRTVLAYAVRPAREFAGGPSWEGLVRVVQGWAVLVERVVLAGWVEEAWGGGDVGPWVWEWAVEWAVGGRRRDVVV